MNKSARGLLRTSGTRQGGFAIIEFTLCIPVLLLLLLAVGEVGRLLSHYNVLLQSSRDAAGYAARHVTDPVTRNINLDRIQPVVSNLAVYGSPAALTEPLLPGLATDAVEVVAEGDEHVRVTIRYTFRPAIRQALPGLFGEPIALDIELVASTVMRAL
ncbi:TadE/TadG family type IV pilus assembly protein [Pseudomonas sp. NW5]|uniref:TadE/TadG family type IV pilus assembly protein n=1 Tax=Pseudomonas sp. NW5 TaxID=2934934 RepID=UPI002020CD84|nr:TadE/TadG family type IV pilus assembly protein [Pseudomonas sp. NW5]MCL7461218.1 pilus assembly protein [Pseudomonas sp. NW5]